MKSLFTLYVLLVGVTFSISAQKAEAVLFSENGELFTAYLNGLQVNNEPMSNVKAKDLNTDFYQLRVDFQDPSIADMTTNMAVQAGLLVTYKIKMNNKGKYVLRLQSEAPLADQTASIPQPTPVSTSPVFEEEESSSKVVLSEPVETTTTTTTTTTQVKPNGEKVEMNVNIDGMNMGVKVDMSGMDMTDMELEESQTVTTTTTTKSTQTMSVDEPILRPSPSEPVTFNGYNGPTGCNFPSQDPGFDGLLNNIRGKSFSDSKMTLAKQYTSSKCLLAEEVKQIMTCFDFEESRLEFAKFAYNRTYDQGNYYLVNEAFDFEMTIDELDEYLETQK